MQTCSCCHATKPLDAFYARAKRCKDCVKAARRARYAADPEKYKAQVQRRYTQKRDDILAYLAQYRDANRERLRAFDRARSDRERTPEGKAAKMARWATRRAAEVQATTRWDVELDAFVLREAYKLAKLREQATGVKWHVDHTVPLRGKRVNGLHNAYNLQVIPAKENLEKWAKFEV